MQAQNTIIGSTMSRQMLARAQKQKTHLPLEALELFAETRQVLADTSQYSSLT